MILIVGTWFWFVEVVGQLFIFGTDITHDITFGFRFWVAIPSLDSAVVAYTLLAAPVRVHRTVTCRAIYVEITFYQVTRIAVFQHAKVTSITIDGRLATHLGNIAINTRIGHAPIGVELHLVIMDNKGVRPSGNRHLIAILDIRIVSRTVHGATIEIRWVVHQCVSIFIGTSGIRVH